VLDRSIVILSAVRVATNAGWSPRNPFIGKWTLIPSQSRMPDEMKVQRTGSNTYAFDFGGGAVLRPRVGEWTSALLITNTYCGKLSNTEAFALSRDLKTLTMTVHLVGRDTPYVLVFERM
jgi:hypothetical protein